MSAVSPLYPPFHGTRLTIDVHVAEGLLPAWLEASVAALDDADFLEVRWRPVPRAEAPLPGPLARAYLRLEQRLLGPLGAILRPLPPREHLARRLADAGPTMPPADVVLGVGTRPSIRGTLATWCLGPEALDPHWIPPHLQDAFRTGATHALSGLEVEDLASGQRRLLDAAEVSMSRLSLLRNSAYQLQKAPAKLQRALRRLARSDTTRDKVIGAHAPRGLLPLAAAAVWRAIPRHAGLAGGREHWFTLLRRQAEGRPPPTPDARGFRVLDPGDGGFLADPFPWTQDGTSAVFAEALEPGGKGEIHAIELGPDGEVARRHVVIAGAFHHSYPFLYDSGNGTRMLVECAESKAVRRWRCERFPDRWQPDGEVLSGWRAVDATMLHRDGRWWLFACIAETPFDDGGREWEDLFAFHAPTADGPWTPHASNPVVQGVHRARPAGAFIVHDGRLFRPAQDGAREYGHRLVFHEVRRLDPAAYVETEAGRLEPEAFPGIRGVHTWGEHGGLEVVDAKIVTHDSRPRFGTPAGPVLPRGRRLVVVVVAALLLVTLAVAPLPDLPGLDPVLNGLHVPVSLLLVAAAGEWMESRGVPHRYLMLALCVPIIATLSEALQMFTPWRAPSLADVALNLAGGLIGFVIHRLRPRALRRAFLPPTRPSPR